MAKTVEKHICKFKRIVYKSGNAIFFCTLPDCNKKINPALALGKRSICWRCGEPFILTEYSLRLAKPHCDACHKPKKIEVPEQLDMNKAAIYDRQPPSKSTELLTLSERLQRVINSPKQNEQEDEI